jgi:hypothetical protein
MTKADDCPFKDYIMPKNEADGNHIESRVGKLEGILDTLIEAGKQQTHNIDLLSKDIGDMREMFANGMASIRDTFSNQLEKVASRLTNQTKPQWQTISAFGALVITLLGMAASIVALIMSGQNENIQGLKHEAALVSDRMFDRQYERGKSDAFIAETGTHLKTLDSTLQREMSLLNATTEAKITGLDTKLQLELELVRKNLETSILDNAAALKDVREWRLRHTEHGTAIDAEVCARQQIIKEKLDKLDERQWDYRVGRLNEFENRELKRP